MRVVLVVRHRMVKIMGGNRTKCGVGVLISFFLGVCALGLVLKMHEKNDFCESIPLI